MDTCRVDAGTDLLVTQWRVFQLVRVLRSLLPQVVTHRLGSLGFDRLIRCLIAHSRHTCGQLRVSEKDGS